MFMEEDMVDFLDSSLSTDNLKKQSAQARHEDYAGLFNEDSHEAKLFSALDNNDVAAAKKILHQVKNEILEKPVGSVERKRLEATLHTLYKKFKHYIETVSLVNKFEEDLEGVEHPGRKETSFQPSLAEDGQETGHPAEEDESLDVYLLDLQHAIAIKDLSESRKAYERAKEEFARLSTDQKRKYHRKLLSAHESIQELLSQSSAKEDSQITQESAETRTSFVSSASESTQSDSLDDTLQKIQNLLQESDFINARKMYDEAKEEFEKLPAQEKRAYHERLLSLREIIVRSFSQSSPISSSMHEVEERLKQAMGEGDLHEAMIHYEELRSLIGGLPEDERSEHTQRAKKYYSWILSAWNSWQSGHPALDQKEKRLSGQP